MTRVFCILSGIFYFVTAVVADQRNPFGVPDITPRPLFNAAAASSAESLLGKDNDKNALPWPPETTTFSRASVDGEWFGRWGEGLGRAKVISIEDRLFALYTDQEGRLSGKTWLLEAERRGNLLSGEWQQVQNKSDRGTFTGVVVNNERIDGLWNERHRWDFRRIATVGTNHQGQGTLPGQEATLEVKCSGQSIEGTQKTKLVVNNHGNRTLKLYWLDYAGKEVFYKDIAPNSSHVQPTFVTHPWCIKDAMTGKALSYLVAGPLSQAIDFSPNDKS